MLAEQLKKSILQAAIQGKLTNQRKEDGTAQDLYNQIQEEKQRLIKEKKIKKTKSLPAITEDEIPFEIPENWMWVRLGDVSYNKDGQRIPLKQADRDKQKNIYDYYGASGVIDQVEDYLFDKPLLLISEDGANLLARTKPIAFIARGKYWVNNHAHVLDGIDIYFLEYLRLYVDATNLSSFITGTAQPKLTQDKLNRLVIALPPLAEQKRIADTIQKYLAEIEQLEKDEEALAELQKAFPGKMKASILQQAIQGKLTDQRKEDGTAQDLYKEIQEEKQKLIKEKKIKKEKPLPAITEDEIPFKIPENWMWVRLGEMILNHIGGGTPDKSNEAYWNGDIPWMSVKDVHQDSMYADRTIDSITPAGLENSSSNLIEANRLIVVMRMAVGRAVINKLPVAINQDLRALFFRDNVTQEYILRIFKILKFETSGMTVKGIKLWVLLNTPIPLPPLAEQKRIVEKLDKLLPLCEA